VNKDGKPDVVTVQALVGEPSIIAEQTFLNNGTGALTPSPELDTTIQGFIGFPGGPGQDVVLSDVNGDQIPDLLIEYLNDDTFQVAISVSLGLGNTTGTFGQMQTAVSSPSSTTFLPNPAYQLADINGDGHPDLIYLPGDGTAALALGVGNGTFGAPSTVLSNLFLAQQ